MSKLTKRELKLADIQKRTEAKKEKAKAIKEKTGKTPRYTIGQFTYGRYTEDTIRTAYDKYEEQYKRIGLTRGQHKKMLILLGNLIIREVCNSNQGFELPLKLGNIRIGGNKSKLDATDLQVSRTIDKKIPYRNSFTGGIIFKCELRDIDPAYPYYKFKDYRKFRSSVPLKKAMVETIRNIGYSHWSVYDTYREVRFGIREVREKKTQKILLKEMAQFIDGLIER